MSRLARKKKHELDAWKRVEDRRIVAYYREQLAKVQDRCEHVWEPWEHYCRDTVGGTVRDYRRECSDCGFVEVQAERPDTDQAIPETVERQVIVV